MYTFPAPAIAGETMLPEIPVEEFSAALDACAMEALWEADVARPPVDAFLVAERLGIAVTRDSTMPHRARFVRLAGAGGGRETIVVGPEERPERRQWAVAHEIGERLAHRVFAALGVPAAAAPLGGRERVANQLAGCLLLPRPWLAEDGRRLEWDLCRLKRIYTTASHELIARRTLEQGPPMVVTLFDHAVPTWRRSNLAGSPPGLTSDERRVWQQAHRWGSPTEGTDRSGSDGLGRVRCWPVHEPEWKREIMQSELCDCAFA